MNGTGSERKIAQLYHEIVGARPAGRGNGQRGAGIGQVTAVVTCSPGKTS